MHSWRLRASAGMHLKRFLKEPLLTWIPEETLKKNLEESSKGFFRESSKEFIREPGKILEEIPEGMLK